MEFNSLEAKKGSISSLSTTNHQALIAYKMGGIKLIEPPKNAEDRNDNINLSDSVNLTKNDKLSPGDFPDSKPSSDLSNTKLTPNSSNIRFSTNVLTVERNSKTVSGVDNELPVCVKMERIANVTESNTPCSGRCAADEDDPMNVSLDGTPSKRNKRKMTEPRRRTTDFSIRSICPDSDAEDSNYDGTVNADDDCHVKFKDIASMELVSGPLRRSSFVGTSPFGRTSPFVGTSLFIGTSPIVPSMCRDAHLATVSGGPIKTPHLSFTVDQTKTRRSSSADSVGSIADDFPANYNLDANHTTPSHGIYPRRSEMTRMSSSSLSEDRTIRDQFRISSSRGPSPDSQSASVYDAESPPPHGDGGLSRRSRKNYKNMTKQRRIEANARERTRVHTISAAFESLRRAVPSYSYNQRLSKLAILRIACSYILALARLADLDYSEEQDSMSFSTCVDLCTQTIQAEGKAKRKH